MDDSNKRFKAQRNREPEVIDTTETGNHLRGNTLSPQAPVEQIAPRIEATGLIWIDQEDHAKQGYARKGDLRRAQAAPDHPYIGHARGGGESQ